MTWCQPNRSLSLFSGLPTERRKSRASGWSAKPVALKTVDNSNSAGAFACLPFAAPLDTLLCEETRTLVPGRGRKMFRPPCHLIRSAAIAGSALAAAIAPAASAAEPDAALLESARRLYQLVISATVDENPPLHPLFVPREAFPRDAASATADSPPSYLAPRRVWPAEAEDEDPDELLRQVAEQPSGEEMQRWIEAALAAPSEAPLAGRATLDKPRTRLDAPAGVTADQWSPLFYDVQDASPVRAYAGRVTQIRSAYDPAQSASVFWAGTVGGGLYKTYLVPPFAFWVRVSDTLPGSPSVGAFLVRPTNGAEILVGTGDWARAVPGTGVYKSVDGGASWSRKPVGLESTAIYRLRSDSANGARVLFAGPQGVYRSDNFGDTWTPSLSGSTATDVLQDPSSPSHWYAAVRDQGVLESDDNGVSFHPFGGGCAGIPGIFGRAELAVSPAAANYVYAVVENQAGALNGIYRSGDYGCHWTSIDALDTSSWGQAFHAIAIAVDPVTPTRLFVGMGGGQWTSNATSASPCWVRNVGGTSDCGIGFEFDAGHSDLTDFYFLGSSVLIGTDGGLFNYDWSTHEVESFGNELGFVTLQTMSSVSTFTSSFQEPNVLLAGLQDNGVVRIEGGDGASVSGGDGGVVSVSPDSSDEYYYGIGVPYHRMRYKLGEGFTSLDCSQPVNGFGGLHIDPTPGLPPSAIDLFTTAPDPSGDPFVWYKPPNATCNWAKSHAAPLPFLPVAIDQNNDPAFWTLYAWLWGDYRLLVSSGSPGSMTWSDRTPPGVDPQGPDMRAFADRTTGRPGTVYYTTGGSTPARAWVTHDKGLAWDDVTGNLALVTAGTRLFEMIGDPGDLDTLFIATEVGVFRTDSARATYPVWYRFMEGMPAVSLVYNLDARKVGVNPGVIRIGTFGHGFWERQIGPTSFLFADGFEAGSTIAWSTTSP
jgi:hypothetical protein